MGNIRRRWGGLKWRRRGMRAKRSTRRRGRYGGVGGSERGRRCGEHCCGRRMVGRGGRECCNVLMEENGKG